MSSLPLESKSPRYPNNLPLQLNSFIGRERELEQLKRLIWSTRLLTLTGPGGCGKTRLAIKVAQQLIDAFREGVWFVDLAPLSETGSVPQAVAAVFGVHEPAGSSFSEALIDYLRPRENLLVLDNCEHLLPACAELANALLRACPNLFLLATSREAFNIDGEVAWQTPPLTVLDPGPGITAALLSSSEATRLFLDRAEAAQPGFVTSDRNAPVIAQVCRQLDGLPLAIELAAARVPTLSVEQIGTRLVDRFDLLKVGRRTAHARHQTLRAMIDWSFGLLSPQEKKLFRRLAIFAGGWTIEAAEAVCSDTDDSMVENSETAATLDVLSRLVDKSLVVADPSRAEVRYRFLETIRQYAQEKLAQTAETEQLRDRLMDYFVEWTEMADPGLIGGEQLAWLERFEREHENIRAVLEWGLTSEHRAKQGLQISVMTARFFRLRGYLSEGRAQLSAALSYPRAAKNTATRARGLTWLANMVYLQGDFPEMHRLLQESLSIWRELGLTRSSGSAAALEMLGDVMMEEGDYAGANALFEQSLGVYRDVNNLWGVSEVLMQIAWVALRTGAYAEAKAWFEENLTLARKTGYVTHISFALAGLGELAVRQGQNESGMIYLEESLVLRRSHGDSWGVGTSLGTMGWIALRQGDYRRMRADLKESIAIRKDIGDKSGIAWCLEKLAEGAFLEAQTRPSKTGGEVLQRAARVFGAAAAIRAPLGAVIDPADQPAYEQNRVILRRLLGEKAFSAAWAEGEQLTAQGLEKVIAEALAEPGAPAVDTTLPLMRDSAEKPGGLSRREREVARLIVQGKSNRDIAEALTVEIKTVEAHITHIFNKLGFDSRVQIAVWAVEKGLAAPQEA